MIFSPNLAGNKHTGSIPTEMGSLRKLTYLNLRECVTAFYFHIMLQNKTDSFFDSYLFSLIFYHEIVTDTNELTGSIPTEVGLLTELRRLSFSKHLIFVLLFYFETRQICSILLTIYVCLSLIFSQINLIANDKFTGPIPTEVGALTKLEFLDLCKQLFPFYHYTLKLGKYVPCF